jgi:hypothetical protein
VKARAAVAVNAKCFPAVINSRFKKMSRNQCPVHADPDPVIVQ